MTPHFWQGGRKIEVVEDDAAVTIQAENERQAEEVAAEAGVDLEKAELAAPGLVRARLQRDRDADMARLRRHRVVHHVYRDARQGRQEYLITDTFYVKFKEQVPRERVAQFLESEHLEVVRDMGDNLLLVRVTDATGSNPVKVANRARELEDVEYAEPNLVRKLQRFAPDPVIPADTLFSRQWHLHAPADVAPDLLAGAGVFAPHAWALTRGSRDVVIAVADDAFDLSHPDFSGDGKVAGSWNLVPEGDDFIVDDDVSPRDGDYHGTPCAGVALAESNGKGVVGVAPGCALLAVRFPLSMDDHHFMLMFERISRVADVVSCSWGYGPADAPMSSALSERLTKLAENGGRRGKGLVICVAAGNNNCPVKDLQNQRSYRFFDGFGVLRSYSGPIERWIAAHPSVITVSACTSRKRRSAYSSWGDQISVCAPSDNWDDLRQVATRGLGVVTTDNEGTAQGSDFTPGSRFTSEFGGTSSATPTVAGVAALVISRNPSLTAAQVKALLEQTADKDLVPESETPVNVPGGFVNGFSPWFGHGKVNAAKAVAAAVPETSRTVSRSNGTEVAIPDRDEPVTSELAFDEEGVIQDLRVTVDVRHSYVGDLRVELVGPEGRSVTLHDHDGGAADDLRRTYTLTSTPALKAFLGVPLRGSWKLRLTDTWAMDEGRLESWRLVVKVGPSLQPLVGAQPSQPRREPERNVLRQPRGEA